MQKHTSPSQTRATHTTCTEHNSLAKDLLKLQCTAERIISLRFFLLPKHRIKIKTSQKIINFSPSSFSGPKYTCQNSKAYTKKFLFVLCVFSYWILAWPLFSADKAVRMNRSIQKNDKHVGQCQTQAQPCQSTRISECALQFHQRPCKIQRQPINREEALRFGSCFHVFIKFMKVSGWKQPFQQFPHSQQ